MSKQLLKSQHFTVWLLRKRGSNWMRIHAADVDMAEDTYVWRSKVYGLKSTNIITYATKLGIQRDLLLFDADKCEPLMVWAPGEAPEAYRRSSGMVGQSISEQALRNSEAVDTIQRQQKIIMVLVVCLTVSIVAVSFFAMYSFGLFKIPTSTPTTPTGPRAILQIVRGLIR